MATRKRKRSTELDRLEAALARSLSGNPAASSRGVADRVSAALIPVEPSQQFVTELGRSLSLAASRSRQSLVRRYRTAILIGAALFGSLASVVGVIALVLRQRSRVRTGLSQ